MMEVAGFDWDDGNRQKCEKHGVSLSEIEAVFRHPHHLVPAVERAPPEARFLAIGSGGGPRLIFVVFTMRTGKDGDLIRPISARLMHRKEIEHYEQAIADLDQ
jgi:uncharacterized protein